MGEIGRELCGLGRIPNNLFMVSCGDGFMVMNAHNDVAADDVVAVNDVVVVDDVVASVGVVTVVDV